MFQIVMTMTTKKGCQSFVTADFVKGCAGAEGTSTAHQGMGGVRAQCWGPLPWRASFFNGAGSPASTLPFKLPRTSKFRSKFRV